MQDLKAMQDLERQDLKVTAKGYDFAAAHAAMRRLVDGDILAGVSSAVLVGRDLVDVNCVGWADKEAKVPLRTDHLFRVFSNTKLITSCAALLLFEEGRFQLDDPIETFIPQLAKRVVLRPGATSLSETEPARGSITIRQLLSHSSGLSYGLFDPGTVLFRAYQERKVLNPATTLVDMVDRWRSCRWPITPARHGNILSRPMSWGGWWKSSAASRSTNSLRRGSSRRSAWWTPPSRCRKRTTAGSPAITSGRI